MCEKQKSQPSVKLWFDNIITPSVLHLASMLLTKMETCGSRICQQQFCRKQQIVCTAQLLIISTFFQVSNKPWSLVRYCLCVSKYDSFILILNHNSFNSVSTLLDITLSFLFIILIPAGTSLKLSERKTSNNKSVGTPPMLFRISKYFSPGIII